MSVKLTARLTGGSGGTVTKIVEIVLPAANWYGGENTWAQIIDLPEASSFSKIDLQPAAEQLLLLQELEIALTVENESGVVTVCVIGSKPDIDITVQATLTEVIREVPGPKIYGNTVGWVMPMIYPKKV